MPYRINTDAISACSKLPQNKLSKCKNKLNQRHP